MGVIGMAMSLLFRLQLAWPDEQFGILEMLLGKWAVDGKLDPNFYMGLVTIHGTIMVFYVLTAVLSGTFSNLLIPLQVGARDMASPFMNMLSYWFFFLSSVVLLISVGVETGPASAGWTVYPPLSALEKAMPGSGLGMTLWLVAIALFIVSALLGGMNYIATVLNQRTKGMSMNRMPLTIWAFLFTAVLGLLSFPVLLGASLFLIFDRSFGTSFYLSDIYLEGIGALENVGGSPVLYQHLFWFLGHPEVYIIILPAMGIASEVLAVHCRKPIFGYKGLIAATIAIAALSVAVWAHHMFASGQVLLPFFSFMTFLIGVPTGVKFFNWIGTMWRGSITLDTPMIFVIGFLITFLLGGLTGIILASPPLDFAVSASYFVVAHFHYVLFGTVVFAMFAGFYFWWPKMTGYMLNERLGKVHFWTLFVGFHTTFLIQHWLGIKGFPRRYADYLPGEGFTFMNEISTYGAILLGISMIPWFMNMWITRNAPKVNVDDPWGYGASLEWATSCPPPRHNFTKMPRIRSERPAFDLHHPEFAAKDNH